jgi:hypothetical protein
LLVTATASFKGSSSTILQTLPMMLFGMRMQGRGGPPQVQQAHPPQPAPEPEPAPVN